MDGRSYESMEGRGRAKQEARAENNAGAIVEFTHRPFLYIHAITALVHPVLRK